MADAHNRSSALRDQAARVLATTAHAWGVPARLTLSAPCPPRSRVGTTRAARAARRLRRALPSTAPVQGLFFAI